MTTRGVVPHSVRLFSENIKFEHTVFALPFAYLGSILAYGGLPPISIIVWVTVAMVAARTAAMCFNRYIDRHIDARNPRTAGRPIPAGKLSPRSVLGIALVSLALLVVAAWQLNPLCLLLSPLAVVALAGYSYTKRWTPLCHVALGVTDAIAPAGGWLAVRPSFDLPMLLLAFAVGIWIGGFDMLYACQDVDFDRREGLHSAPADFGVATGLRLARLCHVLMLAALVGVGLLLSLSWPFYLGVVLAGVLLVYEHSLVNPADLSKINLAFFNVNSYIALTLFVCTLASLYV